MQQPLNKKEKSRFWMVALLSYALFLAVFVGFAWYNLSKNLYIQEEAPTALFAAFCLFSIPWWLFAAVLWVFREKKHWGWKVALIVLLVIALVVAGISGALLMILSLDSATDNMANYLVFDSGVSLPAEGTALFPASIPETAENAEYYYAYSRQMSGMLNAQASWTLLEEEYEAEMERLRPLLAAATEQDSEDNDGGKILEITAEQDNMEIAYGILYNDETHSIRYVYWRQEK